MKIMSFKSFYADTIGHVGHLNLSLFYNIFDADSLDITCPHFNNYGGLFGWHISLVTGHIKVEWNL